MSRSVVGTNVTHHNANTTGIDVRNLTSLKFSTIIGVFGQKVYLKSELTSSGNHKCSWDLAHVAVPE